MENSNLFVLHSLNADTLEFWGQDVKEFADKNNIEIHLPEFPIRAESSFEKFDNILTKYLVDGTLNKNSVVMHTLLETHILFAFAKFITLCQSATLLLPRVLFITTLQLETTIL